MAQPDAYREFSVTGCASCGGEHERLAARRVKPMSADWQRGWEWYASCPATGQTMFFKGPPLERGR